MKTLITIFLMSAAVLVAQPNYVTDIHRNDLKLGNEIIPDDFELRLDSIIKYDAELTWEKEYVTTYNYNEFDSISSIWCGDANLLAPDIISTYYYDSSKKLIYINHDKYHPNILWEREYFFYNDRGFIDSIIIEGFVDDMGWLVIGKSEFKYNSENLKTEATLYKVNQFHQKFEYKYDNSNLLIERIEQNFIYSKWNLKGKTIFTYLSGKVAQEDNYIFKDDKWELNDFIKYSKVFQDNDEMISYYSLNNGSYDEAKRIIVTKDDNGLVEYETEYILFDKFRPIGRFKYTYDAKNRVSNCYKEFPVLSAWENFEKSAFKYNSTGKKHYNYQFWLNGKDWENNGFYEYEYDQFGNIIIEKFTKQENETSFSDEMNEYTYDENNLLKEILNSFYDEDNHWKTNFKYTYSYTTDGLLTDVSTWDWKVNGTDTLWQISSIEHYIYNDEGLVYEQNLKLYNDNTGETDYFSKSIYLYEDTNAIFKQSYLYFETDNGFGKWVTDSTISYSYNNQGLLIFISAQKYINGKSFNKVYSSIIYNERNLCDSLVSYYYTGSHSVELGMTRYIYSSSDAVESTPDTPTASLECAPNPCSDFSRIEINLPMDANFELSIVDLNGKLVRKIADGRLAAGARTFNLDTKFLSSGTYLVSLKTNNKFVSKKLVILK